MADPSDLPPSRVPTLAAAAAAIEAVRREKTQPGVTRTLAAELARLGVTHHVVLVLDTAHEGGRPQVLSASLPSDMLEACLLADCQRHDPVLIAARAATAPFTWTSVGPARADPELPTVTAELARLGVDDGLVLPLVVTPAKITVASLACTPDALSPDDVAALTLVLVAAHNHVQSLLGDGAEDGAILTRRERQCLLWTSVGKTSWETAQILEISQHTADWYIASAIRKLGAANRTQAVAEAIRLGLIR